LFVAKESIPHIDYQSRKLEHLLNRHQQARHDDSGTDGIDSSDDDHQD
jgi:hypothetical protein